MLFLLVSVSVWPAFVAVATLAGVVLGEAWQLDAWTETPKREVLGYFIEGYRASAPIALGVGLLTVIDHWLLARSRVTWIIGGILLPLTALALYFWKLNAVDSALVVLLGTSMLLAVVYRLVDAVWQRLFP